MAPRSQAGTPSAPHLSRFPFCRNKVQQQILSHRLNTPTPPPSTCHPLDDGVSTKEESFPPSYSTLDLVHEEANEDSDPWDLPELKDTGVKWSGEAARLLPAQRDGLGGVGF